MMSLPVAPDWFRIRIVAAGLAVIDEPHADELVRGNIWLRCGRDRDLVVDTGLGVGDLADAVARAQAMCGVPRRTSIVVLTHGHLDHAGGAGAFSDVRAHPADAPAAVATLDGPAFASGIGLDPGPYPVPDVLVDAAPFDGWDPGAHRPPAARPAPLAAGDVIDLGDRRYAVLHLPGHTPGSIALFDEANGELFAGDVVYDDVLLDGLHDSDPRAYAESLRRVRALPVAVVRPGHGDSFGPADLHRIVDGYLDVHPEPHREA